MHHALNEPEMKKKITYEFVWLVGVVIISLIITGLMIGFDSLFSWEIDLEFHDTYVVGSPFTLVILTVCILDFCILLTRILMSKFQNILINIHLIAVAGVLFFLINRNGFLLDFLFMKLRHYQNNEGWTIYPPSASTSSGRAIHEMLDSHFKYDVVIQFVLLLTLILTSIITVKRLSKHDA